MNTDPVAAQAVLSLLYPCGSARTPGLHQGLDIGQPTAPPIAYRMHMTSEPLVPDAAQESRPRVAAVVLNSVNHDTRVLKQAASLRRAGYDVAVFGIRDNRCNDPETRRADGVRIIRCAWRAGTYRLLGRLLMGIGVLVTATAVLAYHFWFDAIASLTTALLRSEMGLWALGMALIVVPAGLYLSRLHRRLAQTAARYEVLDGQAATQRPVSTKRAFHWRLAGAAGSIVAPWVRSREMRRAIAAFRPHIVHCHDLSTLPIGCAYARRHPVRLVYDSHEIFEAVSLMTPWRRRWFQWQQRVCSRHVDLFITINDSIADYLNRKYPALPLAVVVKNAAPLPDEPIQYDGRLHDAASIDRSTHILLYQGGFSRFRGLTTLVNAAPLLPDGWVLVMMGWGSLEVELKEAADRIDPAGERIRFIPGAPLAELLHWTAGASLGVIPYENVCLNHWYCTPNKLWEFPMAGVPVIASPFPELRRVIEQWDLGRLLSDPITPESLAEAVGTLDGASLQWMRANCARFVADDNWSRYAEKLVDAYARLRGQSVDPAAAAPVVSDERPPASDRAAALKVSKALMGR